MRVFYQLLANTLISSITTSTVWFAVIFYLYLQTQSVLSTSILSGVYLVCVALTGIWFGSIVDHQKKKTAMLLSNGLSLFFFSIVFVLYITAPSGTFTSLSNPLVWFFIPLTLFGVIAGNIRMIALPTVVTLLIPEKQRDKANGLVGTVSGVGFLVTSVISGFLVGHSGMYWVLLLAIGSILASTIHLLSISIPEKKIVATHEHPKKIDLRGTIRIISSIPGLLPLIFFTMFNNFLGGVFMALMDAYGLSLVSVQVWGLLWGGLSCAFILGGIIIAKYGLGKNPLWALFRSNFIIWGICCFFTAQPSILLLAAGAFVYLTVVPYIEAAEHTIIQKVVPAQRQGRVFGFAQSIEQCASPITAFAIGPIAQFYFIPFMTTGLGASAIGSWFGTGPNRGIALVFTLAGIIGLLMTFAAKQSPYYRQLSKYYQTE